MKHSCPIFINDVQIDVHVGHVLRDGDVILPIALNHPVLRPAQRQRADQPQQ